MWIDGVLKKDDPLEWPINDDVVEPVAPVVPTEVCKIGLACKDMRAMLTEVMRSRPMREKMDAEISSKLNRLRELEKALGGGLCLIPKDKTKAMVFKAEAIDRFDGLKTRNEVNMEIPAKVFFRSGQSPDEATVKQIRFGLVKYHPPPSAEDQTEKWVIDHVFVLTGKNGYERCHRSSYPTVTLIRGGNTYLPVIREPPEIGRYNDIKECTAILDGDIINMTIRHKKSGEAEFKDYPVSYHMTEEDTIFPLKVLIV